MNVRETEFLEYYREKFHRDLLYESATFSVYVNGIRVRYTPDFFDSETKTFIEVVGSRQAFFYNRKEMELVKKTYGIKLDIVMPDGNRYKSRRMRRVEQLTESLKARRQEAAHKLYEGLAKAKIPAERMAELTGINKYHLLNIADGSRFPHPSTAERILKALDLLDKG